MDMSRPILYRLRDTEPGELGRVLTARTPYIWYLEHLFLGPVDYKEARD